MMLHNAVYETLAICYSKSGCIIYMPPGPVCAAY